MKTALLGFVLILSVTVTAQQGSDTITQSNTPCPRLIRAEVPLYPPLPWSARFGGTVDIEVTVENGAVGNAEVKRVTIQLDGGKEVVDGANLADYLSVPSLRNVQTWRFEPSKRATFVVRYSYRIEGMETELPESPKVILDLPRSVTVIVRPVKPTTTP